MVTILSSFSLQITTSVKIIPTRAMSMHFASTLPAHTSVSAKRVLQELAKLAMVSHVPLLIYTFFSLFIYIICIYFCTRRKQEIRCYLNLCNGSDLLRLLIKI